MSAKKNQAKKQVKTTPAVKREREMSAEELSAKRTEEARKADEAAVNGTATPTKAAPEAQPKKPAKAPKAEPKPKKVSALDAAAKVLGEQGKPMNCQDLIDEMSRKKYWSSPNGATPHATLYAAIAREIKVKGKDARFQKMERGKFASAK
jgi:HB1, ASXL, restriction endonuclease HTH domain